MPSFPKPKFTYDFNLLQEVQALNRHKKRRGVPAKSEDKLLLATWNIANLGLHKRKDEHYVLLAEMLSWFDIIAIQEVNDNLTGLRKLASQLPDSYRLMFSDKGGNNERAAYIYDAIKLRTLEKVGEVSVPPSEYKHIKLPGVQTSFKGFDRNPYLVSFAYNDFRFILVNLHIYFGSESQGDLERRALETYALGRFTDLRRKSKYRYTKNIIALGDFNLPKIDLNDPVYKALTRRGLQLPEHSTRIYSNIVNDKQYDQIAFFPGLKSKIRQHGVFDFDGALFSDLWQENPRNFRNYLRYYLSDHRPMWMQLDLKKAAVARLEAQKAVFNSARDLAA